MCKVLNILNHLLFFVGLKICAEKLRFLLQYADTIYFEILLIFKGGIFMNINKKINEHPYKIFGFFAILLIGLGIYIGVLIYKENTKQQDLYLETELEASRRFFAGNGSFELVL